MSTSPLPRVPVSLRRVCPSASFVGCADVRVADVTERSGDCRPGSMFAAIPGTRVDGTQFVRDALSRGTGSLLVERPLPDVSVPQCIVPSVRAAYARLCSAIHGHPSRRLGVVGVTGTNGKTTVAWLVRAILGTQSGRCGLLGTIEYDDGRNVEESSLTTPDSAQLAEWLARMVANGMRHTALEISSHALHQDRAAGVELDAAIVTNVTRDHFDYHADHAAYAAAKARIADLLKFDGRLIVNADDPTAAGIGVDKDVQRWTFGIDQPADIRGEIVTESLHGTRFVLHVEGRSVEVELPLVGRHNVSNALAAAAACRQFGIGLSTIRTGLEATSAIPGRLERVPVDDSFHVFVDYAHTPDALDRVLGSLRPLCSGRLICVFGAGGDRDRAKRPEMGRAANRADIAIVTSDNPRSEDPVRIADEVRSGLSSDDTHIETILDRRTAIQHAVGIAEPGDVVVIAGKGHETVQIVGNERHPFDDREVVREITTAVGAVA